MKDYVVTIEGTLYVEAANPEQAEKLFRNCQGSIPGTNRVGQYRPYI